MKYLVIFIAILASPAFACSDFKWDWSVDKWISKPEAIYHGVVASISLGESSIYDGEIDPLKNTIESIRGDRHIKLKVSETLKGDSSAVVSAVLTDCIGGLADFGTAALLFRVGDVWHIKSLKGDSADEVAPKVLGALKKIRHRSDIGP